MSKSTLINVGLFLAAFVGVFFLVRSEVSTSIDPVDTRGERLIVLDAEQRPCVRDASQVLVPVHAYQRIVSLSASVDGFLLAAMGPGRLHGLSAGSKGKPYVNGLEDKTFVPLQASIETLVATNADLIIVPSLGGDLSLVNRLREAGLLVFHIGGMTGIDSFNTYCAQLSALCKIDVAGSATISDFNQRLDTIMLRQDPAKQKSVLYMSVFNAQIYGGTKGSSYHDVIVKAGLKDACQLPGFEWSSPWPQLSVERILQINPDYLLIPRGMLQQVQSVPGLDTLDAVKEQRIVEIDGVILHDAGMLMYQAALELHEAIYGKSH